MSSSSVVVVAIQAYKPRTAPLITPEQWTQSQAWPAYYHHEVFRLHTGALPQFADGRPFLITRAAVALMYMQAMHQELPLEQFRQLAFREYTSLPMDRRLIRDLVEWAGLPDWPKFARAVGRRVRMEMRARKLNERDVLF